MTAHQMHFPRKGNPPVIEPRNTPPILPPILPPNESAPGVLPAPPEQHLTSADPGEDAAGDSSPSVGEWAGNGWTAGFSAADPAPTPSPGPPAAARVSSGELLTHAVRHSEAPAQAGWRGALVRCTGARVRPRPSAAEAREREQLDWVRASFNRPQTIVVANPKGGAGKTPAALALAATLGLHRGGYVAAWDNNETRGTLGIRSAGGLGDPQRHVEHSRAGTSAGVPTAAGPATVWDLLSGLDRFERPGASVGDLAGFMRPQPSRFDVLASDEDADQMAQIGAAEFERLHAVLSRFYRMLVIDTGNNLRAANWQAAIAAADALVVVSTYEWDTAYSASWMLDHLCGAGREDLVAGAVTVLTSADPRPNPRTRTELLRHFARTAAVVEIPYEAALRGGGQIHLSAMRPASARAWLGAAATICQQLHATPTRPPVTGTRIAHPIPAGAFPGGAVPGGAIPGQDVRAGARSAPTGLAPSGGAADLLRAGTR